MKRNFLTLALAGAFGLALIGSASAGTICPGYPAGTHNGGLLAGNYAVRLQGYVTDPGTCFGGSTCPDPTPAPIAGLGVITVDGNCNITAGELIYDDAGTLTAPTSIDLGAGTPWVPAFAGTQTVADTGYAAFNSNNIGVLQLTDTPSGNTWQFGVVAEAGGSEIRGALMSPGDPLTIVLERQKAGITAATFVSVISLAYDWGTGFPTQATGVGGGAIGVQVTEHADPETGLSLEGGGSIFFNVDNGYDSSFAPGIQLLPPGGGGLICDFHESLISAPGTADGTQNTDAALDGDWSCPLAPAHFENASVVWGTANQYAWVLATGASGVATTGVSMGTAGKAVAAGTNHVSPGVATLTASNANLHPSTTLTITNDSAEPLDYAGLSLSGVPDVTITGGTCVPGGSDLPANNPLALSIPLGTNVCTIILQDSGAQCTTNGNTSCISPGHPFTCCTGPGAGSCVTESGTLLVAANDHTITPSTQTGTGATIPVNCK